MNEIKIGNTTGQYFTQWRLDACLELAHELQQIGATDLHVWYDPHCDFHHCDGVLNGKMFSVSYYKVFHAYCNGHDTTGLPRDKSWVRRRLVGWSTQDKGNETYGQPVDVNPTRYGLSPNQWATIETIP